MTFKIKLKKEQIKDLLVILAMIARNAAPDYLPAVVIAEYLIRREKTLKHLATRTDEINLTL